MRFRAFLAALVVAATAGTALAADTGPSNDPAALDMPPVPPSYHGIRLSRSWVFDGTTWSARDISSTFGAAANVTNVDASTLTPSTAVIGTTPVNPGAAGELAHQAATYGTWINRTAYTSPITFVPADQPLTPVGCYRSGTTRCISQLYQMMSGTGTDSTTYVGGGLPIPDDFVAPTDTDAEAIFYQPDYVSPCNSAYTGRLYEAWKLRLNPGFDSTLPVSPANPKWLASGGLRALNLPAFAGYMTNWTASGCRWTQPGNPDSTYRLAAWSVIADGGVLTSDMLSREDCKRFSLDGTVPNHAVGIEVHNAHTGHWPPFPSGDGTSTTLPIEEGMKLRIPPGVAEPSGLTPIADLLWRIAQARGVIIDDKTADAVTLRVETIPGNATAAPECSALIPGATSAALSGFPWGDLEVVG